MTGVIRFNEFTLDADARELSRDGRSITLSPKAYQLLEMLVESCPKAISKHALLERLWPDSYVVEKNLINLVVEIRHALEDDRAHPRFIRTVHRYGYAFRQTAENQDVPPPPGGPIRFRLTWADRAVALRDGEHVVGRDPELEIFLDSPGVSRRHALIRIDGGEATIEDLDSKNGTFVANTRLNAPARLTDQEIFFVGSVRLTLAAVRPQPSTETENRPQVD